MTDPEADDLLHTLAGERLYESRCQCGILHRHWHPDPPFGFIILVRLCTKCNFVAHIYGSDYQQINTFF